MLGNWSNIVDSDLEQMDKLFSSLSGALRVLGSKKRKRKNSKNKEILLLSIIENNLTNWKLPPISSNLIYKSNTSFQFKSDYVVKTVEQASPIHEGLHSRSLFSERRDIITSMIPY